MKKIVSLITFCFLSLIQLQSNELYKSKIKKYFMTLDKMVYEIKEIEENEESTEGGLITVYNSENNLNYFTVHLYGETKRKLSSYYILEDNSVYITIVTEYYRMPSMEEMLDGVSFTGEIERVESDNIYIIDDEVFSIDLRSNKYSKVYPLEIITLYNKYKNIILMKSK